MRHSEMYTINAHPVKFSCKTKHFKNRWLFQFSEIFRIQICSGWFDIGTPWAVPWDFCSNCPKLSGFETRQPGNGSGGTRGGPGVLSRWSLPPQHSLRHHNPPKSSKFTQNPSKSQFGASCLAIMDFENVSRQLTSVLVDLISSDTSNDY